MTKLVQSFEALRIQLQGKHPGIAFGWTGEPPLRTCGASAPERRLAPPNGRCFPLTLVLLLIAFRSLISAILPVLCGALTVLPRSRVVAALQAGLARLPAIVSIIDAKRA